MEAVLSDIQIDAAKTGMLGDAELITMVAEVIAKYNVRKLVV